MNKNNMMILTILLVVVAGAGGFFGGIKYQQSKRLSFSGDLSGRFGGPGGQQRGGINRGGFRPVAGQIISSDDKSITVKLNDGSSKIVFVGDSTSINKADKVDKSALVTGKQVAVFGTDNADGSVTAQTIQLDPIQMGMFRGASPSASAAPNTKY